MTQSRTTRSVINLISVQHDARRYLDGLSSLEAIGLTMLKELKYNRGVYEEAILLLHINPSMNQTKLSAILSYNFDGDRMDVITDFFLREDLNDKNKKRSGREILSSRQLARCRKRESGQLMDVEYKK